MKAAVLNIMLFWVLELYPGTPAQAQYIWAHPAVANIDTCNEFPYPVYMHGSNYFRFISKNEIDSCSVYMASDSANVINRFRVFKQYNQYNITSLGPDGWPYKRIYEPIARIVFYFKNGTAKTMALPLLFHPPAKVEFLDSAGTPLKSDKGVFRYYGVLFCVSSYNQPYYAVGGSTLFEQFEAGINNPKGDRLKTYRCYLSNSNEHTKQYQEKIDLREFKNYKSIYFTIQDTLQKEIDLSRYPLADRFSLFKQQHPEYIQQGVKFVLKE